MKMGFEMVMVNLAFFEEIGANSGALARRPEAALTRIHKAKRAASRAAPFELRIFQEPIS